MRAAHDSSPWLARFARLKVAKSATLGPAPLKPLLLLALLDAIEAGEITSSEVVRGPALVLRFREYWPIVQERRGNRPDIRKPFYHLSSDGVWEVFDAEGRPARAFNTGVLARLPEDLMALLADAGFRTKLRHLLVTTYFPSVEQAGLAEALGIDLELPELRAASQAAALETSRRLGRSARFKNGVIGGYRYTCLLTGHRLVTANQEVLVEAAHVHAFSAGGPDTPDNGLALSPTAHKLFDLGLWGLADDLTVLVSPESVFVETSTSGGFSLRAFAGKPLHLPPAARLRPAPTHLRWHRDHRLR